MSKKALQGLTAMLLSVIMVADMLSVSAMAQAGAPPIGANGEITAFAELTADIAMQSVPLGTSEADLELPDTLTATVSLGASKEEPALDSGEIASESDGAEATPAEDAEISGNEGDTVASPAVAKETEDGSEVGSKEGTADSGTGLSVPLPVTWGSSPEYDSETVGIYIFTPELPESFVLAEGVELPIITVTVGTAAITGMVTAFDTLPDDIRWQSVEYGTSLEDLNLPKTLTATVEGETAQVSVTWEADPEYDGDIPGAYAFTAAVTDTGFLVSATPPVITVTVEEALAPLLGARAVDLQAGLPPFTLGLNDESNPTKIRFGGEQWSVIGYNGSGVASPTGTLTLFVNGSYGATTFRASGNEYSGSNLQAAMNAAFDGLPEKEQALVAGRTLAGGIGINPDNVYGADVTDAKFWPLSITEANSVNTTVRAYNFGSSWLRTFGYTNSTAATLTISGAVNESGTTVNALLAIRPAFQLDISDVLFASSAEDGKNDAADATLSAVSDPTSPFKFTVKTSSLTLTSITQTGYYSATKMVTFGYTGATAGKTLSAIVTNSSGAVTHYGKLVDSIPVGGNGSASVALPVGFAPDLDALKIFVEECNDNYETDFASEPVQFIFEVDTSTPDIIGFGGRQWTVIGDNGNGVASTPGTLTLFANESFGNKAFNALGNAYSGSLLQTAMDKVFEGLPQKEQSLVVGRTLTGGSGNYGSGGYDDDNIAGAAVEDAKFWPLSAAEANSIDGMVRRFGVNWWLRSPGQDSSYAARVSPAGGISGNGDSITNSYAVRPAFYLDIPNVLFTSAAMGGKNDVADVTLSAAPEPTGPYKFTVNSPLLTLATATQTGFDSTTKMTTFGYSGATAGETLSMIVTRGGEITYYGKLAENIDADGSASVVLPADFDSALDTLKIFVEECNGDNKTDFCSAPVTLAINASRPPFTFGTIVSNPTIVGFGGKQWAVMGNGTIGGTFVSDTLTLFSYDSVGNTVFDDSSNEYSGSTFQSVMDGAANNLSALEKSLIIPTHLTGGAAIDAQDGMYGSDVDGALFWPLSTSEARLVNDYVRRIANYEWWLRSPGNMGSDRVIVVDRSGAILVTFDGMGIARREARPACNLNLTSVLFTSAAGGKSSATVGGGLVGAAQPASPIKFTASDSAMATPSLTLAGNTNNTGQISFGYSGAATGTNQYISCVLEQGGGIKYYGKLADCATSASGNFTLSTSGIANGSYTLKIFCEQANGDNYTDFAGTPVTMSLTVSGGAGTVSGGGVTPDNDLPTVSSVTPSGSDVARSGDIVITFSEAMRTTAGTVRLNELPALTGGEWSVGNTVFTVPYSGLGYSTVYTVTISGFKDAAGNTMTANSDRSFTSKTDTIAPTAEVQYKTNGFKAFLNTITFGRFFKNTVTVTIQGADSESGVATIEYYRAASAVDAPAVDITDWTTGTSFSVTQRERFILYVRVTDNAGNTAIFHEGVVVYTDSAAVTPGISFTKGSAASMDAAVTLNGNTIASITNGAATLTPTTDYTVSGGTITFTAAYLETLTQGGYTLTVHYNPMGEAYVDGEDNEAPASTAIALTVVKPITITDADIIYGGKAYDGDTSVTGASISAAAQIESGHTVAVDFASAEFDEAGAGSRTVVFNGLSLGGADAAYYSLTSIAVEKTGVTISKAASGFTATTPGNIRIITSNTAANTYDLAANLNPTAPPEATPGTVSYALGELAGTTSVLTGAPTLSGTNNNTLNYTGSGQTSGTATQEIIVSSDNYADITVTLTFEAIDKTDVTITGLSIANSTYTGIAHAGCAGTPGFTGGTPANTALTILYTGTANDGSSYSAAEPPTKAGSYTVTVTLANDLNYKGEWTADFTIDKAAPTYTVPTGLTATYGQTLGDVSLAAYTGFSWNNSTTAVGDTGNQTHTATFTPADTNNYSTVTNVSITVTVNRAALTITSVTAISRPYDGTNAVLLSGGSLVGVESGDTDNVSFTLGSGLVEDKNAGDNKAVDTDIQLTGSAAGNYTLTQPGYVTVDITKKPLTLTSATAESKMYDGDNTAAITGLVLGDLVEPETLAFGTDYTATGAFGSADVGAGQTVTVTPALKPTEKANNYSVAGTVSTTADIIAIPIGGSVSIEVVNGSGNAGKIDAGDILTANTGGITPSGATFSYQWYRDGAAIGGATAGAYTVAAKATDPVGSHISVKVTGTGNYTATVESASVEVDIIPLVGSVSIDGSTALGDTLTLNITSLAPADAAYSTVWLRDGSATGQTGDTYTVTRSDLGKTVSVQVTGTGDYSGIKTAETQIPVIVPEAPAAFSASAGNSRITLSWTAPFDGGSAIAKYQVSADNGASWQDIGVVTSYTVTGLTNGTRYAFQLRAVNGAGDGAQASASATPAAPSSGNGNHGGSSTTTITIITQKAPDQPVTAVASVTATAAQNGAASASIPEKAITDAIAKAQADAKAQGTTANGIAVELDVTMPQGATALTAVLTQNSLSSLISAGVHNLAITGSTVTVTFDKKALAEIRKQSSGAVTISITPVTDLFTGAQSMIGGRPVYDITVSYVRDGKTITVSSLSGGIATISIPYIPGAGEAPGYLYGVYVSADGAAQRIDGSAYDANAGAVLISTGHLSVYGVGYTAPSAKFTDTAKHWAAESIDYVVGRGLLAGTSDTTFAPDTTMTRSMLVTALGRLANVNIKAYTTNSFTDVKADSAFRPYIEWARSKGVVQGVGNGQFAPDRAITREEIAVIFANYAKATGYTLPITREAVTYADNSSIGSTYKTAVTAMQQAGIMMGGTGNKFNPKSSATRAEVSTMLHRYIKLTIDAATAQAWAKNDAG